jgi:hypothetical protein
LQKDVCSAGLLDLTHIFWYYMPRVGWTGSYKIAFFKHFRK